MIFLLSKNLETISNKFLHAVPNAILAILVFFVGLITARIISKGVEKFLHKSKVDKLGDKLNDIDLISKSSLDIKISKVLSTLIYYFLLIIVAMISAEILQMPVVSQLIANIIIFFPNLIVALIILIIGLIFSDAIRKVILTTCDSLGIPASKLISSFVFYFLFISIFISALTQIGIETSFLARNISIIIGGAVIAFAVGYGLASKDMVANYLASSYSNDFLKVGDHIKIEESEGRIKEITKSSITIETDKSVIVVPMNKISKNKIEIFN